MLENRTQLRCPTVAFCIQIVHYFYGSMFRVHLRISPCCVSFGRLKLGAALCTAPDECLNALLVAEVGIAAGEHDPAIIQHLNPLPDAGGGTHILLHQKRYTPSRRIPAITSISCSPPEQAAPEVLLAPPSVDVPLHPGRVTGTRRFSSTVSPPKTLRPSVFYELAMRNGGRP